MTKVQTNDGHVLEIPQGLVDACSTLKMVCEMTDCTDDTWAPLPNNILRLIGSKIRRN